MLNKLIFVVSNDTLDKCARNVDALKQAIQRKMQTILLFEIVLWLYNTLTILHTAQKTLGVFSVDLSKKFKKCFNPTEVITLMTSVSYIFGTQMSLSDYNIVLKTQ